MQIHNAAVTGSFIYNGVDLSSVTSSTTNISSLNAITASILSTTASLNLYTGSNDTNILNINSTTASLNSYTGSNNTNISNIHLTTASLNTFTGSAQSQLSALQAQTGSYATTGSNTFIGNQTITGSIFGSGSLTINGCITSTGQIVAQTINVQQVTSSIVYSCGSNVFGCAISNTQQLTGSVGITGSLSVNGVSAVVGTGTTNYLPKFTGASTIGDSVLRTDNDGNIFTISGSNWGTNAGGINLSFNSTVGYLTTYYDDNSLTIGAGVTQKNGITINGQTGGNSITFRVANSTRLTLDASGNLGLGVTPSAWSGTNALQINQGNFRGDSGAVGISHNGFFNGSNFIYQLSTFATDYYQLNGTHVWRTAPSGTAGNAITFTQAMTLNASGNLSIGNTNDTYKLDVSGTGRFNGTQNTILTTDSNNSGGYTAHQINFGGVFKALIGFGTYLTTDGGVAIRTAESTPFTISIGSAVPNFTIASTGAATFNSSVIVNNATTDAASALQVKVLAANATSARITSTTNNNLFSFISNGAAGHAILDMGRCTESGTFAAGFIRLRTDGDSWIQGGNVGIGTNSPTSFLDVYNPAESSVGTISWQNGGRIKGSLYSDSGGIAMHVASDFNSAAIYMVPNDQIQFRLGNATPRLLLTNAGCVACFAGTVCAPNFIAASSGTVQACRIYTGTSDITVNNGTFTTIFSSTGNGGVWLVSFALNGNPSQVGYAIVGNAFGSSITLLAASSGSQTCLTSSGLNLQLCQTSGANLTARVSNILLTSILA